MTSDCIEHPCSLHGGCHCGCPCGSDDDNCDECVADFAEFKQRPGGPAWVNPGLVTVTNVPPVSVPYPVSAEHPPADSDG